MQNDGNDTTSSEHDYMPDTVLDALYALFL